MPSYQKYETRAGVRWSVRWDIAPDPETGKRRQKRETGFRTRADARQWYDDNIAGNPTTYTTITVSDYLTRWIAGHRHQVKPGTAMKYERTIAQHLAPHLGKVRLRDLKPDHIRAWHAQELEAGNAPSSIHYWQSVLSTALMQAVRDGLIPHNPARHAPPPAKQPASPDHWTPDEIRRFLRHCPADDRGMVYRTALMTGLRPGELIALEWPAVDLERGVIQVVATATVGADGRFMIGPPKTRTSRRRVVMPDQLRRELAAYRREYLSRVMAAGPAWDRRHEFVFPGRRGDHLWPSNLNARLRRFCTHIGLRPISAHALRHSWATWMLSLREHPAIVGAQLGHTSISTTIDTYSHVSEDMQREAAERLDDDLAQYGA